MIRAFPICVDVSPAFSCLAAYGSGPVVGASIDFCLVDLDGALYWSTELLCTFAASCKHIRVVLREPSGVGQCPRLLERWPLLAFGDLGMEAIYEFDVKDMPVTVAVDSTGNAVHDSGPREWRTKIGKIPVKVV